MPYLFRIAIFCVLLLQIALANPTLAEPTGTALAGMEPFDEAMAYIVNKWEVPGAGLAVAKDGRLLLARGYGFANKESKDPVLPGHLFRFGSLTKTVTAVAVLQLVEDGELKLDDKVLPIIGELGPRPDKISDPRVKDITIRQLLQHTGGWDRDKSGDPISPRFAIEVSERQGVPLPPTCALLMRDAFEVRLDFAPGERYAYSNVGYCILGRVIEKASGQLFDTFVRRRIFDPISARSLQWGRSLEPMPGEVYYYDYPGAPLVDAMPGIVKGKVAAPYGYLWLEGMDAFGSLIGSPTDYLKFLLAIDGRYGSALLKRASIQEMQARPAIAGAKNGNVYYGLGVSIRPYENGANVWHGGTQPGMSALALRNLDGSSWVVTFNTIPKDRSAFALDYDRALQTARERMRRWPSGNLFSQLP